MPGKGQRRVTNILVRAQQLRAPTSSATVNGQADTPRAQGIVRLDWSAIARRLRLSAREVQIIQAIIDEQKDQAIAWKLGISQHTVRTHLDRLFQKLDAHSRTGIVVRIFDVAMQIGSAVRQPN